jgi:hypothetical protein
LNKISPSRYLFDIEQMDPPGMFKRVSGCI